MSELSHGWAWVDVQDLAANEPSSLTDGPFGSNLKTSHYTDSGPRVIRLQNIGDGAFVDERAHISEEHFQRLRRHEARANDVVIAMLGERLPRACVVPDAVGPAIVKADCVRLRVEPGLSNARYVTYALNSQKVRSQAEELVHGVGRPRLGLKWLRRLKIPLAPVPEQHRIVEAIESYFTRLDDAVATLERVQRNLKRYRASVLKAAVEGRLIPTEAELARAEGRNYEPASVFLERILAERRRRWEENELARMKAKGKMPKDDTWKAKYQDPAAPDTSSLPDLPEGWCWVTIGQCSVSQVGHAFESKNFIDEGVRLLRGDNIGFGVLRWDEFRKRCIADDSFSSFRHLALEVHDIVLAMDRPIVSGGLKIATVRDYDLPALLVQRVLRLRPFPNRDYFLINLHSQRFINYLTSEAKGGGVPHLSEQQALDFPLPLPPYAEQVRISAEVDRLLATVLLSSMELEATLLRSRRLRQSILKGAFEGRLVDQSPTDEPASMLLERIKAERAAATTTTSNRKPRHKGKSANA